MPLRGKPAAAEGKPRSKGRRLMRVPRLVTGRRAAARNQQSSGLLVSPRKIPCTGHIRRATFCGGVKTPPYRIGRARSLPKSAKCREVLRSACMRPLRIDRTRSRPKNDTWGKRAQQNQHPSNPFACRCRVVCRGRIYAARQGCAASRGLRLVARSRWFVGRGLDPAEPMIF